MENKKAMRKIYTDKEKETVIKLHKQHKTDSEIVKITGFGYGFIQIQTTNYWKNKTLCAKQLQDKLEDQI